MCILNGEVILIQSQHHTTKPPTEDEKRIKATCFGRNKKRLRTNVIENGSIFIL